MSPDLDSTLSAIDAATGCQQCEGPLGNSPSDSFCSDGCQGAWFASRSEPLEMEQHSPEPASVSSYARYWLNRWAEETSPPGGAVRIALYTSNPASDGQSSVATDAHGGRWHNSSIAVEWAGEIHVRNEEVATRYRESLQMVSDHWIDTGLLPAAQSETADDPDPQRRQRAPRRIKPEGEPDDHPARDPRSCHLVHRSRMVPSPRARSGRHPRL
jgi:hypothetical protein